MRPIYLLLVLIAAISCVGQESRSWPPSWDEIVKHLNARESDLIGLISAMEEDAIDLLVRQDAQESPVVNNLSPRLEAHLRPKYKKLFDKTGVWMAERRESLMYFQIEFPWEPNMYSRYQLEIGASKAKAEACVSSLKSHRCGFCTESIKPSWTLSYYWIQDDVGRNECLDDLNLDFEARTKCRDQAVEQCFSEYRESPTAPDAPHNQPMQTDEPSQSPSRAPLN